MKELPFEMMKEILKYQKRWWLNGNMELVNIEKLSQIPIPQTITEKHTSVTLNDRIVLSVKIVQCFYGFKYDVFVISFNHKYMTSEDRVNWHWNWFPN